MVSFPPGTKGSYVRENRPLLFIAILAAAGPSLTTQKNLNTLLMETKRRLAHELLVEGLKTVECIQALHVTCMWYKPSNKFQKHTFYQLIHIASNMAIELGLNRPINKRQRQMFSNQDPYLHWILPNPESIECRRTWLVCYYCCLW